MLFSRILNKGRENQKRNQFIRKKDNSADDYSFEEDLQKNSKVDNILNNSPLANKGDKNIIVDSVGPVLLGLIKVFIEARQILDPLAEINKPITAKFSAEERLHDKLCDAYKVALDKLPAAEHGHFYGLWRISQDRPYKKNVALDALIETLLAQKTPETKQAANNLLEKMRHTKAGPYAEALVLKSGAKFDILAAKLTEQYGVNTKDILKILNIILYANDLNSVGIRARFFQKLHELVASIDGLAEIKAAKEHLSSCEKEYKDFIVQLKNTPPVDKHEEGILRNQYNTYLNARKEAKEQFKALGGMSSLESLTDSVVESKLYTIPSLNSIIKKIDKMVEDRPQCIDDILTMNRPRP